FDLALATAVKQRRVIGQRWWIVAIRTHIGKDQSAQLAHGIGKMLHLLAELAVLGLRRHLHTLAVNVEQPTMIGTTQSAVFDIAVFQRRAAVRTMLAEQTQLAVGIAKQHQLFAKNFDRLRNIVEIASNAYDQPIASKPLSRRRIRTDMGDIGD